jgi:hypothetical protein
MSSLHLSNSESELLSKFILNQNTVTGNENNPNLLPKIIEHIVFNYSKLNKENSKLSKEYIILNSKINNVYKDINNIIIINNKLTYHFQLSLLLIFVVVILNIILVLLCFIL